MDIKNLDQRFQLSTFIICIYVFLTPLDLVLNLTGSGTVLKFIGMVLGPLIILEILTQHKKVYIGNYIIFVLLYLFYYIFSFYWSYNPSNTYVGLTSLSNLIALLIVLSIRYYSEKEINLIAFSSIISIIYISFQMISSSSEIYFGRGSIGINDQYVDPNDLSAAYIVPVVFCIAKLIESNVNKLYKTIYFIFLIYMSYGLLLTGSRGGLLGVLVAVSIYLIMNSNISTIKKIIVSLGSLVISIIFFNTVFKLLPIIVQDRLSIEAVKETGGSGRSDIWLSAWSYFVHSDPLRSIFGNGLATFSSISNGVGSHNLFLQTILDGGIIGSILFLIMIITICWIAIKNKNWTGLSILVGTLVISLTLETWNKKFFWNAIFFAVIMIYPVIRQDTKQIRGKISYKE